MELKPGYKQTEVGVIPEGWEVRRLSDLAKIRSGIAKNSNASLSNPVTVPYLRVANVQDGFLDLGEVSSISIGRDDLERYLLSPGDVLMNEGGDLDKLGRGAIWRGELNQCIHQNHVFAIRCTAALLPEFLNAWASGKAARRYFVVTGKQTTNLASINKTAIGGLPIALPSPREQQQIAEALGSLSAHEASFEDLIEKKKRIKQAAMQELLTGKRRLPGFEGEREVKRLGEIGKCHRGVSYKGEADLMPHDTANTIRLLRSNNVQDSFVKISELKHVYNKRVATHQILTRDDIVICMANGSKSLVGKAGRFQVNDGYKYTFGAFMGCFRTNPEKADPGFTFYLLQTERYQRLIGDLLAGSSINNLKPSSIESLEFLFPERAEQLAIATVLSDIDAELTSLQNRRDSIQEVKQGMMQQLLTGKIRLR
jgi:type I restriction enzyme S subunit